MNGTMVLRKETFSPDEELSVHKQNIIHTRVVRGETNLESIDPEKLLSDGLDSDVELEVWYVEKESMSATH
jgi:hypothetical protein